MGVLKIRGVNLWPLFGQKPTLCPLLRNGFGHKIGVKKAKMWLKQAKNGLFEGILWCF